MILNTLTFQPDKLAYLCAVCVSDRSGGKIALLVIITALIFLAIANWGWKKYFTNKKEVSTEK